MFSRTLWILFGAGLLIHSMGRAYEPDNRDTTYQITIGYEHIEDAWLNDAEGYHDLNYGGHDGALAGFAPSSGSVYLLRIPNLPELIGGNRVITSCSLYVFVSAADGMSGDKWVGVKRVFKPWIAGILDGGDPGEGEGCTFHDWSADAWEWGLPGCHHEDDDGVDNQGDGEGADCRETSEDSVLILQTGEWPWVTPAYRVWAISPELTNGWYDGTCQNNGLVMKTIAPWGWVHPWQTECAAEEHRPYFAITCQSAVAVILTPLGMPIVIPPEGGPFDFIYSFVNSATTTQVFDTWGEIYLPATGTVDAGVRSDIVLPGEATLQGTWTQTVPRFAPPGTYTYAVHVGVFPWIIHDSDTFTFEKEGGGSLSSRNSPSGWLDSHEFPGISSGEQSSAHPEEAYLTVDCYPNPFNPTTLISYRLQDASLLNLTVYDVSGRAVAELVNGWRDAGIHEVTFDGSGLASGVYLYRLEAGDQVTGGKVVLTK